jgi:uncharacterized membrane protein
MDLLSFLFNNTPLAFMTASLWRDEAFSYLMAKLPLIELLAKTAQDSNPPLYYLVLKLWMFVWGSSELSMRTLSLLFFWGTLYVAFITMRNVFHFSFRKSLTFLLLFLANPILHYFAFEVRMYSMLSFFGMLFIFAVFTHNAKLSQISLICGLFTHYFFLFIPLSYITSLWMTKHKKEVWGLFHQWKKPLLIMVPWALFVILSHPPIGQSFWISTPSLNHFLYLPAIILTGYDSASSVPYRWLPQSAVVLWLMLGYIVLHLKKHITYKHLFLLFVALGVPLIILTVSLIKPIYTPRYLIFSSATLILFLSIASTGISKKARIVLFVLILLMSISFAHTQIQKRVKAPLRVTYNQIVPELRPGDRIYVVHEFDYHPALYYFEDKAPVYIFKRNYEMLPWFIGKVLIPFDSVQDSLPTFPERAFVVLPDGSYSIQSRQ